MKKETKMLIEDKTKTESIAKFFCNHKMSNRSTVRSYLLDKYQIYGKIGYFFNLTDRRKSIYIIV